MSALHVGRSPRVVVAGQAAVRDYLKKPYSRQKLRLRVQAMRDRLRAGPRV